MSAHSSFEDLRAVEKKSAERKCPWCKSADFGLENQVECPTCSASIHVSCVETREEGFQNNKCPTCAAIIATEFTQLPDVTELQKKFKERLEKRMNYDAPEPYKFRKTEVSHAARRVKEATEALAKLSKDPASSQREIAQQILDITYFSQEAFVLSMGSRSMRFYAATLCLALFCGCIATGPNGYNFPVLSQILGGLWFGSLIGPMMAGSPFFGAPRQAGGWDEAMAWEPSKSFPTGYREKKIWGLFVNEIPKEVADEIGFTPVLNARTAVEFHVAMASFLAPFRPQRTLPSTPNFCKENLK